MSGTRCIIVSMEAAINNISIPKTLTDMLQATLGKDLSVHCATTVVIRKRLLKCHSVVHQSQPRYTCQHCDVGFKHNNQIYQHRQKCF